MDVLPCGHVAYSSASRMCPHLIGPEAEEVDYVRLLTGRGLEYDLCCVDCDGSGDAPELTQVCEGCADRADDEDDRSMVAWRGRAGIGERPEPVDATVTGTPLPRPLRDPLDWVPLGGADGSQWLFLTGRGRLVRFDAGSGVHEVLARVRVPREAHAERSGEPSPRPRLHVSSDGRYAAVVIDYGRCGTVVDLGSGRPTMDLDGGGDGRAYTVPFALAFAEHEGRAVLVHRTRWNRLDVSDPATGALLTARERPEGGPGRDHSLDYFHGALHVSPDGRYIADDGWVWSPVGVPSTWDLRRWLEEDPWESEDGPTRRRLCWRDYCWDEPMCWVSDGLVAVSGIGHDDICLLDGVRIFDAETGVERLAFAGPRRPLMADDRRLYSAGADGLEIWDPFTGERTGAVPGFRPERHHRGAAELASLGDGVLRRWATRRRPAAGRGTSVPGGVGADRHPEDRP